MCGGGGDEELQKQGLFGWHFGVWKQFTGHSQKRGRWKEVEGPEQGMCVGKEGNSEPIQERVERELKSTVCEQQVCPGGWGVLGVGSIEGVSPLSSQCSSFLWPYKDGHVWYWGFGSRLGI